MFLKNLAHDVKIIAKEIPLLPPWKVITSIVGSPTTWLAHPQTEFQLHKNVPETTQSVVSFLYGYRNSGSPDYFNPLPDKGV